jgi:hypothetical protein
MALLGTAMAVEHPKNTSALFRFRQISAHDACCHFRDGESSTTGEAFRSYASLLDTPAACSERCERDSGCAFFSYSPRTKACMLCAACCLHQPSGLSGTRAKYASWQHVERADNVTVNTSDCVFCVPERQVLHARSMCSASLWHDAIIAQRLWQDHMVIVNVGVSAGHVTRALHVPLLPEFC